MSKWQHSYQARLRSVADVDAEIERVQAELTAAEKRYDAIAGWQAKLEFLKRWRGAVDTPPLHLWFEP